jgi:hypothetical protein
MAIIVCLQSSGGISLGATNTPIDRGLPGVLLINPRRSNVTILLWTDGAVTSKYVVSRLRLAEVDRIALGVWSAKFDVASYDVI